MCNVSSKIANKQYPLTHRGVLDLVKKSFASGSYLPSELDGESPKRRDDRLLLNKVTFSSKLYEARAVMFSLALLFLFLCSKGHFSATPHLHSLKVKFIAATFSFNMTAVSFILNLIPCPWALVEEQKDVLLGSTVEGAQRWSFVLNSIWLTFVREAFYEFSSPMQTLLTVQICRKSLVFTRANVTVLWGQC